MSMAVISERHGGIQHRLRSKRDTAKTFMKMDSLVPSDLRYAIEWRHAKMLTLRFLGLLLICHRIIWTTALSSPSISYRTGGQPNDKWSIVTTLSKELMNPLSVDVSNFIVATPRGDDSQIIGFAQIRPLGTTVARDPNKFNAAPGSWSIQQQVDDDLWDELEDDESFEIPGGWQSLPWTKEYRAFSEQAKQRRERREELLQERIRAQSAQVSSTAPAEYMLWELASVYVRPEYRHRGIGSELVRRCLGHHVKQGRQLVNGVYLLTLRKNARWYASQFGFDIATSTAVPKAMQLEIVAGTIVTKMLGEELCCMRASQMTLDKITNSSLTS